MNLICLFLLTIVRLTLNSADQLSSIFPDSTALKIPLNQPVFNHKIFHCLAAKHCAPGRPITPGHCLRLNGKCKPLQDFPQELIFARIDKHRPPGRPITFRSNTDDNRRLAASPTIAIIEGLTPPDRAGLRFLEAAVILFACLTKTPRPPRRP
ncbi:MAG: hypothetical protein AAB320_09915 [Elusimicrobiota bacterium]